MPGGALKHETVLEAVHIQLPCHGIRAVIHFFSHNCNRKEHIGLSISFSIAGYCFVTRGF